MAGESGGQLLETLATRVTMDASDFLAKSDLLVAKTQALQIKFAEAVGAMSLAAEQASGAVFISMSGLVTSVESSLLGIAAKAAKSLDMTAVANGMSQTSDSIDKSLEGAVKSVESLKVALSNLEQMQGGMQAVGQSLTTLMDQLRRVGDVSGTITPITEALRKFDGLGTSLREAGSGLTGIGTAMAALEQNKTAVADMTPMLATMGTALSAMSAASGGVQTLAGSLAELAKEAQNLNPAATMLSRVGRFFEGATIASNQQSQKAAQALKVFATDFADAAKMMAGAEVQRAGKAYGQLASFMRAAKVFKFDASQITSLSRTLQTLFGTLAHTAAIAGMDKVIAAMSKLTGFMRALGKFDSTKLVGMADPVKNLFTDIGAIDPAAADKVGIASKTLNRLSLAANRMAAVNAAGLQAATGAIKAMLLTLNSVTVSPNMLQAAKVLTQVGNAARNMAMAGGGAGAPPKMPTTAGGFFGGWLGGARSVSNAAKAASLKVGTLGHDFMKLENNADSAGASLLSLRYGLLGIAALGAYQFSQFDEAMTRLLARTKDFAQINRAEISRGVFALSGESTSNATSMVKAMDALMSSGMSATMSMKALAHAENFAVASGMKVEESAKRINDLMYSMDLVPRVGGAEGVQQYLANYQKVADLIVGIAPQVGSSEKELLDAFTSKFQTAARVANLSIEESVTMLGLLSRAGEAYRGAKGGNLAARAVTTLSIRSVPGRQMWLHMLGEAAADADGQMKPLFERLSLLQSKLANVGSERFIAELRKLASIDTESLFALEPLLRTIGGAKDLQEQLGKMRDAAQKAADAIRTSLRSQVVMLWNSLSNASTVIGQHLAPALYYITKPLNDMFNAFVRLNPAIQNAAVVVGALVVALGPLRSTLAWLARGAFALLLSPLTATVSAFSGLASVASSAYATVVGAFSAMAGAATALIAPLVSVRVLMTAGLFTGFSILAVAAYPVIALLGTLVPVVSSLVGVLGLLAGPLSFVGSLLLTFGPLTAVAAAGVFGVALAFGKAAQSAAAFMAGSKNFGTGIAATFFELLGVIRDIPKNLYAVGKGFYEMGAAAKNGVVSAVTALHNMGIWIAHLPIKAKNAAVAAGTWLGKAFDRGANAALDFIEYLHRGFVSGLASAAKFATGMWQSLSKAFEKIKDAAFVVAGTAAYIGFSIATSLTGAFTRLYPVFAAQVARLPGLLSNFAKNASVMGKLAFDGFTAGLSIAGQAVAAWAGSVSKWFSAAVSYVAAALPTINATLAQFSKSLSVWGRAAFGSLSGAYQSLRTVFAAVTPYLMKGFSALMSVAVTVGGFLATAFSSFMKFDWIGPAWDMIQTFGAGVRRFMHGAVDVIEGGLKTIGEFIRSIIMNVGNAVVGMVASLSTGIVSLLTNIIPTLISLVAIVALLPVVLAALAAPIVTVGVGISQLFSRDIPNAMGTMQVAASKAAQAVATSLGHATGAALDLWESLFGGRTRRAWTSLKVNASSAVNGVLDQFKLLSAGAESALGWLDSKGLSSKLVEDTLKGMKKGWDTFRQDASGAMGFVVGKATMVGDALVGMWDRPTKGIRDFVNSAYGGLAAIAGFLWNLRQNAEIIFNWVSKHGTQPFADLAAAAVDTVFIIGNNLKAFATAIGQTLISAFKAAFGTIKTIALTLFTWFETYWGAIVEDIGTGFRAFVTNLFENFKVLVPFFVKLGKELADKAREGWLGNFGPPEDAKDIALREAEDKKELATILSKLRGPFDGVKQAELKTDFSVLGSMMEKSLSRSGGHWKIAGNEIAAAFSKAVADSNPIFGAFEVMAQSPMWQELLKSLNFTLPTAKEAGDAFRKAGLFGKDGQTDPSLENRSRDFSMKQTSAARFIMGGPEMMRLEWQQLVAMQAINKTLQEGFAQRGIPAANPHVNPATQIRTAPQPVLGP